MRIAKLAALGLFLAAPAVPAAERIRVVTSIEDLAAIAREVAGDLASVESIAPGTQDPHFVEMLPSYMVRVRRADVYVKVGMDLDLWALPIIDGSRNAKLVVVDCGAAIPQDRRLEVPARVDPSMGDIHRYGNPHYWLDPENGRFIAGAIADGLAKADPSRADAYRASLRGFEARLDAKLAEWKRQAEAIRGLKVVTYHNSWPYFARAFGVEVVDWIEPKPGVKPSPGHVRDVIEAVRAKGVKAILYEPYFESRTPAMIAREAGVPAMVLPPSVGGVPEVKDYFGLFDYNLATLARLAGK